jgi:hypothetical protein
MTTMLPDVPAGGGWRPGDEVVGRTIRGDWAVMRATLAAEAFERVDRLVEIWRAARVLERVHRVEIEVARVAVDVAELRIVPWTAHWPRWGNRRQRRYLEAAHAAADDFQKILSVPVVQRDSAGYYRTYVLSGATGGAAVGPCAGACDAERPAGRRVDGAVR